GKRAGDNITPKPTIPDRQEACFCILSLSHAVISLLSQSLVKSVFFIFSLPVQQEERKINIGEETHTTRRPASPESVYRVNCQAIATTQERRRVTAIDGRDS